MRPVPCSPKLPMQIRRRTECTNQSNRLANGVRVSARKKSWSNQAAPAHHKSSLQPIGAILHCQSDLNRFTSIYIDYPERMGAEEGRRRRKGSHHIALSANNYNTREKLTFHGGGKSSSSQPGGWYAERASKHQRECASLQRDAARQAHSNKMQKLCDPQRAPCD